MAWLSFYDWWWMVQQNLWQISYQGMPVSRHEGARYIFWQILQRLKWYHDQEAGYGNLLRGVFIGDNMQIDLVAFNPNNQEPFALICQDHLDFKILVTWVETQIPEVQVVGWCYSSDKFHLLYQLLQDYAYGIDGLRRFGFFVRNNPLFLDVTAKFLFYRKVLTLHEYNPAAFRKNVWLGELQNWSVNVTNPQLVAVREFRPNMPAYARPDGSVVFFRNCEGHVRRNNIGGTFYDDAKILRALEDDLPMVIPTWFFALVRDLDLNRGYDLQRFLSAEPSIFT